MNKLERLNERFHEHHRRSRTPGFVFARPERAEFFRRTVGGPGRRVLDVGCRDGALASAYLAGNDVVGVDVDRAALAEAAKLGLETVWADVEEALPFEDESFDVVVAAELLEHLQEPERLMAEAARLLRPGGTVTGSVPNSFRVKNRLRFLAGRPPEEDPTALQFFRPQDVLALLEVFDDPKLRYVASRFLRLHPRLFANVIVFSARKPV
jgi:2-polyprenyl-3-methyl-5-hydroxy-6-metoxy-1,4-benzoquinol methylase